MKKRLLLLFTILAVLAVAGLVLAVSSVSLQSPTVTGQNVSLECIGTTNEGNLAKVEFWTDTTGTWAINYTDSSLTLQIETVSTTIENIPNGNYEWNCKFFNDTVDNSGNFSALANGTFQIDFTPTPENTAPQFSGPIANYSFPEDTTASNVFDLDNYFSDTDSLDYSSSGNSSITVTINGNNEVTFTPAANWSGAETITFTASDGSLSNSSNGVFVNVTAVNDPPYLSSGISNQSWSMNTNRTIDLGDHFSDIDTTTLVYTSTDPDYITVNISGDDATLVPQADWVGNVTITFYANDSINRTSSNVVNLNVKSNASAANSPPSIDSYVPLISIISMKNTDARTFEITKSDSDSDNLTVKWQWNGNDISGETSDSYLLKTPEIGNHSLKVIVSDGELTASRTWTVKVKKKFEVEDLMEDNASATTPVEVPDVGSIIDQQTAEVAKCGDGVIQEGENCANCAEDVKCADNEVCVDNLCVEKTSKIKAILIILGIAVIIGGAVFFLYRLNTHKQEVNAHRGGIRREDTVKDISQTKRKPVSDVNDYYNKMKEAEAKKKAEAEKNIKTPEFKNKPLEDFVKQMRSVGHTEQEIASKLKEKGWPAWQVEIALKKIK